MSGLQDAGLLALYAGYIIGNIAQRKISVILLYIYSFRVPFSKWGRKAIKPLIRFFVFLPKYKPRYNATLVLRPLESLNRNSP